MNKLNIKIRIFSFSIIFITIFSIIPYPSKIDILKYINITGLLWIIMGIIFIAYFSLAKNKLNIFQLRFVKYYLIWNIIMFITGAIVANGYWEFKVLIYNSFGTFLAITTFIFIEPNFSQKLLSRYFNQIIWLTIPLIFLVNPNAFGFFLFPFSLLILLFPFLDNKWKVITIIISILIFLSDLDARSTIIKFGIAGFITVIYYMGIRFKNNFLNLVHKILMFAPFVLFLFSVIGIFNPFNIDSYLKVDLTTQNTNETGQKVDIDLKSDTRTALYIEVLNNANYFNSWIFGRTPAKGNKTELFDSLKTITGTSERNGNEVAILNVFTWTGLIGVFLYFLIFYKASWLAINKSNSYFIKMLGIYISFRWILSWVEDINNYSLNYLVIWIMLSMAYSEKFRLMTNAEIMIWTKGIFKNKYQLKLRNISNKAQGK